MASPPLLSHLPLLFHPSLALLLALLLLYPPLAKSNIESDVAALLSFKGNVSRGNPRILASWNNASNICISWVGVTCIGNGSSRRVVALRLPGRSLYGPIPRGTLGRLVVLHTLSLRSNKLSGSLPEDLSHCSSLRKLFLHRNLFSGPLDLDFSALPQLSQLDLSDNNFNGSIPSSLNSTRLKSLLLQNNSFSGSIPPINVPTLKNFSVANNRLNGSVPSALSGFPASSFSGNALCGFESVQCPESVSEGCVLSAGAITGIVIGGSALILALILLYLCFHRRRSKENKKKKASDAGGEEQAGAVVAIEDLPRMEQAAAAAERESQNNLIFIDKGKQTFDLEALLRASAEVLGRGTLGTVYKAVLEDGTTVAVKRLRDIAEDVDNYQHRIDMIGQLKHQNLVPLRAYFLASDEKLLVSDYMPNGSLSALLHGTRGSTALDWDSRVRIALSSARGIAYLHGHRYVHGNIKSSNVLLTRDYDGCLIDYCLVQLVSSLPGANKAIGYVPPETTDPRRVTDKADVYSFGVLLLELLTGKPPTQVALNDDGFDLARWVQSVVREKWTAEVFDVELMNNQDNEEEMLKVLQIAMPCVATSPDQRPNMPEVLKMMENVKNNDDSFTFYHDH